MKRLLGLVLALGLIVGAPAAHVATGAGGDKVQVCHVVNSVELPNGVVNSAGMIIEIDCAALPAHLAHGDAEAGSAAVAPNGVCCFFTVLRDGTIIPGTVAD